ncbi:SMI1/KNR4 family protein [Nocardia jiangsuensis]|uniref:SMI1/KNR4 family protein n=1 Tax=Nocardia jiangsuensis TaxID=1691563 RepID=A0ABV8DRJ0_9NOCA
MEELFEEAYPPVSENEIAEFESEVGHRLPEEYRDLLGRSDGGDILDNDRALVSIFGIAKDLPNWLSVRSHLEWYAGRIPDWLFPVGGDAYGNLFAISLRISDSGTVWFWDHEEEAGEGEDPTDGNLTCEGKTFNEFLAGLVPLCE